MKKNILKCFSGLSLILNIILWLTSCSALEKRTASPKKMIKDIPLNQSKNNQVIKKRLLVLPFIDSKKILSDDMSLAIKKAFIRELNKNEEVVSFDSKDLNLSDFKMTPQGSYDFKDIQKKLKEFSVHSGLEVQIHELKIKKSAPNKGLIRNIKIEYECSVIVKVVNQNGKELFNTMKTVTYKDQEGLLAGEVSSETSSQLMATLVKDALFEFVPQVAKSLEAIVWEGRIASIQGERMFLNVGKVSGLSAGDLLRVVDEGEEIYDSESGQFIGKSPGRLKGTLEVVSFFGQDGAIAIIHSGAGFRESDRVELY